MTALLAILFKPLVVWLYGALCVGSLIMIIAWGYAAVSLYAAHGEEMAPGRGVIGTLWRLRWHRGFVVATGLVEHAVAMFFASSMRVLDILLNGFPIGGSWDGVFLLVMFGLADSKRRFVWAGSIDAEQERRNWPWAAFVVTMIVWAVFCARFAR